MVAIGLDLGATRLKAVVVENDGTILDQIGRPTQCGGWMEQVSNLLKELLPMYGAELQIGVCAPGLPNRAREREWRPGGIGVELRLASLGEWAGAFGAAREAMKLSSNLRTTN